MSGRNNWSKTHETYGLEDNLNAAQMRQTASSHHHGLDDESNDHLASIYESRDEQFAAIVPFVRKGLERGERCLYLADDNATDEVERTLRNGGVDVEDALDSGALSIVTNENVEGDAFVPEFDQERQLSFWEETLAGARDREFAGIRVAVEMTWALDGETSLDRLVEYEARLNSIFSGGDYTVLCQYRREHFSSDVLSDVIRTHPLVVYNGTVCQNFYYDPPDEFFGSDRPSLDVDRTVDGLVRHTEQLRRTSEKFRSIFEHTNDAVFVVDVENDAIVDTNPAVADMLGYSAEELRSLAISDVYAGDASEFESFARSVVAEGSGWTDAISCRAKDGEVIPAEISASVVEYDDRPYLLANVRDVSERKRAQAELEETVAKLRESNAQLERFAYVTSHDLQEPLRMVSSYLDLLDQRYGDELDSDAREFVEFAVDGAERMKAMMDGLLEYSRVDTHGAKLERTDCGAVLDETLANLELAIEDSDAEITTDELPEVRADETQLVQLFQNLVSNAIKYAGESPPRIHVAAESRDDEWLLSVRDDGVGIDLDDTDRIFEVFKRLRGPEEGEGTGIGLAMCKKIVERHNGRIWVESEPGEGSTFYFTLPALASD